ncbi:MAG TPA: type II toxin-antitoxin system RelE/ParE family toxin [Lichenihabitans sp.]|jgi:plasmid stabilization system protein ParE|nr:type II toxin-antitoxin system RelE/ParE family toxin [Lichenihabitans sp.]
MKVRFTWEAREDLLRIGDAIAQDSPSRAIDFVRQLRRRARKIGDMPLAFPVVPRFEAASIRRCVFRNYLIFDQAGYDAVTIVHILHGARDHEAILSSDG